MSEEFTKDVGTNVFATFLYVIVVAVGEFLLHVWDRRDPREHKPWFLVVGLVWIITNAAFVEWLPSNGGFPPVIAFLVSTLIMALVVWRELNRFWSVGLAGAAASASRGIDYRRSLRLVKNELDFMGIGAAKLTKEAEFEKAIQRCRQERPIRFLLSDPSSRELEMAATRSNKADPQEYRRNVLESLRRLARLKQRYDNIEVRFYTTPGVPLRLMFIDEAVCLVGYNVFGEGDGSDLPQLQMVRVAGGREVRSFYYPFRRYFDMLWENGTPWDCTRYLNHDEV